MGSRKRSRSGQEGSMSLSPRMNLYRDNSTNMVTATFELPGLKPGDVIIDFLRNKLTISGEFALPAKPGLPGKPPGGETPSYTTRELPHGKFSRDLTVPLGMKPEDFKARMENGLLTVTYPLCPPEEAPRRIPIE